MPAPPGPTTDRTRYTRHPVQVAAARHRAQRVVTGWGANRETAENVSAVVSELVTNAVIHARTPRGREVGVTLILLDSVVRIEVRDADSTLPTLPPEPPDPTDLFSTGRGLLYVDSLCGGRWGSAEEVIGKTVWAEVPLDRAASDAPAPRPSEAGPDVCQGPGPQ